MVARGLTRMIRQVLYRLKRDYGAPIDVYQFVSSSVDPKTGDTTVQKTVYPVRQAIVLPAKVFREEIRGIALISSNKRATSGGWYGVGRTLFIVDRADVPIVLSTDDWIVHKGRKYEIHELNEFEDDSSWVIVGRAVIGDIPEQIHTAKADSFIALTDAVTGSKS